MLGCFNCSVSECVGVPIYDVPNVDLFTIIAHNAIESVFSPFFGDLSCGGQSLPCVNIIFLFVYGFDWLLLVMALLVL